MRLFCIYYTRRRLQFYYGAENKLFLPWTSFVARQEDEIGVGLISALDLANILYWFRVSVLWKIFM